MASFCCQLLLELHALVALTAPLIIAHANFVTSKLIPLIDAHKYFVIVSIKINKKLVFLFSLLPSAQAHFYLTE